MCLFLSLSLSLEYIYIYIYICIHTYTYIHTYIAQGGAHGPRPQERGVRDVRPLRGSWLKC